MVRILLNSQPISGIKFGMSAVVLPPESSSRLKRPARVGSSMKFVVYAVVSATSGEKTLLMLSFILIHRNSGDKLRRSPNPPKVFVLPLFPTL